MNRLYPSFARVATSSGLLLILSLALVGAPAISGQAPSPQNSAAADLVLVPGTKVRLSVPAGFTPSTTFKGYMNPMTGCSLLVNELPFPYPKLVVAFQSKGAMTQKGMKILSRTKRMMGEFSGELLEVDQDFQGNEVHKTIWIFGSDREAIMVMSVVPRTQGKTVFATLRAMVRSAVWDPKLGRDRLAGIPVEIRAAGGLKLASTMSGMLSYTLDGKLGSKNAGEPMFLCAPGLRSVEGDRREFVERHLYSTSTCKKIVPGAFKPITTDRLSGFSCTSTAQDVKSGEALFIHQVILFEGASYWVMKGIAAAEGRETHLPTFERMAGSFHRKIDTLRSTDGRVKIDVPATWSARSGLNEEADLQAGNSTADCYMVLLTEDKSGFDASYTCLEHSKQGRASLEESASTKRVLKRTKVGGACGCRLRVPQQRPRSVTCVLSLHHRWQRALPSTARMVQG